MGSRQYPTYQRNNGNKSDRTKKTVGGETKWIEGPWQCWLINMWSLFGFTFQTQFSYDNVATDYYSTHCVEEGIWNDNEICHRGVLACIWVVRSSLIPAVGEAIDFRALLREHLFPTFFVSIPGYLTPCESCSVLQETHTGMTELAHSVQYISQTKYMASICRRGWNMGTVRR